MYTIPGLNLNFLCAFRLRPCGNNIVHKRKTNALVKAIGGKFYFNLICNKNQSTNDVT